MSSSCSPRRLAVLAGLSLPLALAGCSSTLGGGSDPPPTKVIVVPQGATAVCPNGSAPPC